MATTAYIGLGSNLGDKEANIKKALELLGETPSIQVKKVASLYKTAPLYTHVSTKWPQSESLMGSGSPMRSSYPPDNLPAQQPPSDKGAAHPLPDTKAPAPRPGADAARPPCR